MSSARQGFRSSLYLLGLTYQGFGLLMLAFALLALGLVSFLLLRPFLVKTPIG
ncbi:potassium transporter TrkG, partial [Thermus scotoductus]